MNVDIQNYIRDKRRLGMYEMSNRQVSSLFLFSSTNKFTKNRSMNIGSPS